MLLFLILLFLVLIVQPSFDMDRSKQVFVVGRLHVVPPLDGQSEAACLHQLGVSRHLWEKVSWSILITFNLFLFWTLLIVVEYTNTALFQRYEWNELSLYDLDITDSCRIYEYCSVSKV